MKTKTLYAVIILCLVTTVVGYMIAGCSSLKNCGLSSDKIGDRAENEIHYYEVKKDEPGNKNKTPGEPSQNANFSDTHLNIDELLKPNQSQGLEIEKFTTDSDAYNSRIKGWN